MSTTTTLYLIGFFLSATCTSPQQSRESELPRDAPAPVAPQEPINAAQSPERPEAAEDTLRLFRKDFESGAQAVHVGDFETAAKHLERALSRVSEPLGLTLEDDDQAKLRAYATVMLALIYDLLDQKEKSSAMFEQAQRDGRKTGSTEILEVLRLAAEMHQLNRDGATADVVLEKVNQVFGQMAPYFSAFEPGLMQPIFLVLEAQNRFAAGRYAEVVPLLERALPAFRERGSRDLEIQALALLASTHASELVPGQRPRFDLALPSALEAVERSEEILDDTHEELLVRGFMEQRQTVYELAISLLNLNGRAEDAFLFSEKARARGLLHLLGNRRPLITHGVDPKLVEDSESLRRHIVGLENRLPTSSAEERHRLREEIQKARHEYDSLRLSIELQNPEYASFLTSETVGLEKLRQDILDEETAIVSYFVYPTWLLAWVVDSQDGARAVLPVSEDQWNDLRCQIEKLSSPPDEVRRRSVELLHPPLPPRCRTPGDPANNLYDRLIAPLEPYFRGKRHLIVIPHDFLHHVPFAALRNHQTGEYLINN